MSSDLGETPVHSSVQVQAREDIYRNNEWWKSAVRYRFEDSDATEVAVYLWHDDGDGWTRKNKYVVKTAEAWAEDRERIERFLSGEFPEPDETFPTSDYYTLTGGETVFHNEEWWKAIVNVGMKGDYEADEVMIYLWQKREGDWRRRQKSTIKSENAWAELSTAVDAVLEGTSSTHNARTEGHSAGPETNAQGTTGGREKSSTEVSKGSAADGEMTPLEREIDAHLSATLE